MSPSLESICVGKPVARVSPGEGRLVSNLHRVSLTEEQMDEAANQKQCKELDVMSATSIEMSSRRKIRASSSPSASPSMRIKPGSLSLARSSPLISPVVSHLHPSSMKTRFMDAVINASAEIEGKGKVMR